VTLYTVHIPPHAAGQDRDQHVETVFIPDATSLMALVFPFFWLIWYRLWWAATFYALLTIFLVILMTGELGLLAVAMTIFPRFFLLLEGQELRRTKLARHGWKMVDTVEDQDLASAEYRYFYTALEQQQARPEVKSNKTTPARSYRPPETEIEFPGGLGTG
jgi:hypothetical protein